MAPGVGIIPAIVIRPRSTKPAANVNGRPKAASVTHALIAVNAESSAE